MQRYVKILSMSLMVGAMLGSTVAYGWVEVNIANGKKIFEQGKGDVPACNSCHGPQGMGNDLMGTPRLAGQGYQYIVKQLEDFATDKRQDTTMFVMNNNAKGLTPQDRKDIAAYLHEWQAPSEHSKVDELKGAGITVGVPYLGKAIATYGIPEKGVPACKSCHDYNGRGVAPIYPRIGEQRYAYLLTQLKHWRDGSRHNDPMSQMQHVAQKLSDDDIQNVASFLMAASPYTIGDSRLPEQVTPIRDSTTVP